MTAPYLTADATAPAYRFVACTPSDTATFEPTRGIYVGTAGATGTVKVDGVTGTGISFVGMVVGIEHALQVTRVYATGTDASNIVLLY